jgi:hypothetical protein
MLAGEYDATVGCGLLTAKPTEFDVPPPGEGELTVICAVPAVVKSDCGMLAWSCVELMNVVARAAPFHNTVDEDRKPVPFTVTLVVEAPTTIPVGVTDEIVGAGLLETLGEGVDDPPPPQPTTSRRSTSENKITVRGTGNMRALLRTRKSLTVCLESHDAQSGTYLEFLFSEHVVPLWEKCWQDLR